MAPSTLDLYTWHTPNGRKPAILLAELDVPYELHAVDISKDEQKRPVFLAINPNGKIPALVDRDPELGRVTVFESGAILQYLAEKHGRFLPSQLGGRRAEVLSWLTWQVSGPGPAFGQLGQLGHEQPRDAHAFGLFEKESRRLVGVLDQQLADREYIVEEYSIADIACYPWFEALHEGFGHLLADAVHVQHWLARMAARPAVKLGMKLGRVERRAA